MKNIIAVGLLFLSMNSFAGISAVVIAYGNSGVPVNSIIDVDAEYVAMSVSISSDAKYPAERARLIGKLQSLISSKAGETKNIDFLQGAVSLSPNEKSSFSISKSYNRRSGSSFYLLSRLGGEKNVYTASQEIFAFISRIQKPKDTSISLGQTSLAIESPEKYRDQLLKNIKSEIENTRQLFGSSYKVSISGLENPVIVRQKNDKEVTVFINYQVNYSE